VRLILLGTGCPVAHPRRYGPAQLIEAGDTRLLVDCGSGVTQRLREVDRNGAVIDALLITHLHSDHVIDLWQLLVSGWHQGRTRPLRVLAPEGFGAFASALAAAWAGERRLRLAYERRPNPEGFELQVEELVPGRALRIGPFTIEPVEVDHRPVAPALGFALTAGSRRLVLSGDTRPCDTLVRVAQGCDLLVHEVFAHHALRPSSAVRRGATTIAAVADYHTSSTEVGEVATAARVKALLLTHIVPPDADPIAIVEDVRRHYAGPVIVGEDLLEIDLALGLARWRGLTWTVGGAS
jgi:ribonuclease Z